MIPITARVRVLYGFLILQRSRREFLWLSVTAHQSRIWPSYSLLIAKILIAFEWQLWDAPNWQTR
jgi:hypothetical protein